MLLGHVGALQPVHHQEVVQGLAATVTSHVTDALVLATEISHQTTSVPARIKTIMSRCWQSYCQILYRCLRVCYPCWHEKYFPWNCRYYWKCSSHFFERLRNDQLCIIWDIIPCMACLLIHP